METVFSLFTLAKRNCIKNNNGIFHTLFYGGLFSNWCWRVLYFKKIIPSIRSTAIGELLFVVCGFRRVGLKIPDADPASNEY